MALYRSTAMTCGCRAVAAPRYRIVSAVGTPADRSRRKACSQLTMRRDPSVPLSRNHHLLRWVEKMKELTRPAQRALGRRLAGRERRAHRRRCCASRHAARAQPGNLAGLLLRAVRRERRRPRRAAHVRLLALGGCRRPDEQLGEPVRDAAEAEGPLQRRHAAAGRCTCCRSAWGSSARRCRRSASS